MIIRLAEECDIPQLIAIDPLATTVENRQAFIRRAVMAHQAHVAMAEEHIVGYAVLEHTFFERGFISMLFVHPDHRRSDVGSALIPHLESLCESERLFTSTNSSNRPMQALLDKLGYTRSGRIDDLDPGDPEVVYSKRVRS